MWPAEKETFLRLPIRSRVGSFVFGYIHPMPDTQPPAVVPGTKPDPALAGEVTIGLIRAAAERVEGTAHRTPVLTSQTLEQRTGASGKGGVWLKCENFQRVGAFKFRGAFNAMACLPEDRRRAGVLTYSSGNHAQAVALAASMLGITAVIVMPSNAPKAKLEATRSYLESAGAGSEVVEFEPAETAREALGRQIAEERGLTIVPPYDHPEVIAGQGTAALELFEDAGPFDRLYVCCGGGGLLSGCATVARALAPECKVIGVEPEAGDDATRSFQTGELQTVRNPKTIADGARTPYLGRYTFSVIRERVDRMMTVSDSQLIDAMRLVWERMKLVVEPSGVLGLAGLLDDVDRDGPIGDQRVGVIVSGGNLDLSGAMRAFERGAE